MYTLTHTHICTDVYTFISHTQSVTKDGLCLDPDQIMKDKLVSIRNMN